MNYVTGAVIYREIENVKGYIDDYRQNSNAVEPDTATFRLIQKEIATRDKHFKGLMEETYVKKSDFERRQLELYEEINLWKKKYEKLKNNVNKQYGVITDDEP